MFNIFESKSLFISYKFNITDVITFYAFLRQLKKISIGWIGLFTICTTYPWKTERKIREVSTKKLVLYP